MEEGRAKTNKPVGTIKLFLEYVLAYLIVLLLVFYGMYQYNLRIEKNEIITNERVSALLLHDCTNNIVSSVKSDVLFLTRQAESFYQSDKAEFYHQLSNLFYEYSLSKQIYDQIRFIDQDGTEQVRINYTADRSNIVQPHQLQNKAERYYFQQTINLNKGDFYFSPLDLNIEYNQVEIPYKPMLRIGSPVFNDQGQKIGIVVVNYLAERLIEKLRASHYSLLGNTLFLNHQGYYFIGLHEDDEWGFMFPEKKNKTFGQDFPEESETIYRQSEGAFSTARGIFVFSTIIPVFGNTEVLDKKDDTPNSWKLVSFISRDKLGGVFRETFHSLSRLFLVFSLINLLLLWMLARNVTQRKLAGIELVKKNKALQDSNATKDKFFSIIAHDLRALFHNMLGLSDILKKDIDDLPKEDVVSIADSIYQASHSTYDLLENLLNWSRLQTGKLKAFPGPISLHEQLNRVLPLVKEQCLNKNITCNVQLKEDVIIYSDREMFFTILRNLISNAIKFTPRGGAITFNYTILDNTIEIVVTDTGIGMDAQTLEHLFTVDKVKSRAGTEDEVGSGLGLSLCKEFVEKNNGTIRVTSEPGNGSSFFVSLPLAKTAD